MGFLHCKGGARIVETAHSTIPIAADTVSQTESTILTFPNPADRQSGPTRHQPWVKLAVLILVVAALRLPINDLFRYALLVIATVLIVTGSIAMGLTPWLGALAAVGICIAAQVWL